MARSRPRWLRDEGSENNGSNRSGYKRALDTNHSDMGELLVNALGDDTCLEDVGYKTVYQSKVSVSIKMNTDNKPKDKAQKGVATVASNSPPAVFEEETIESETMRLKKTV